MEAEGEGLPCIAPVELLVPDVDYGVQSARMGTRIHVRVVLCRIAIR